ncbi:hypothetical protein BDW42DRAFT_162271 [Aspergillus taichungensis]|uniref:Uncharacterized protein n=1 Tax=Aspergillus taichungensis TaxID=482145 RepID=A0A2J5I3V0_9EURO|nr:hypothetical protein BDW42DRAFT_162271 [Aspergillus taichungensis]
MPPVASPPLVPMSSSYSYFSGTSNSGSYTTSLGSESDSWSRHSGPIPRHPQVYVNSGDTSVAYHPSTKRLSPSHRDCGPIDTSVAASRPAKQVSPDFELPAPYNGIPMTSHAPGNISITPAGPFSRPPSLYREWKHPACLPPEALQQETELIRPMENADYLVERPSRRTASKSSARYHSQRRPSNRDEFDGPHQYLEMPSQRMILAQARDLPHLPTNLDVSEQDQILSTVNDRLSQCAFDFVAKYRFPIPLEPDKRQVRVPSDREWTEWVYLLKRLATKRRIPARVLYNNQIKQLVTVLENSLEMRHAAKHQSRPIKDDRNVLQLISAGTQVAKILKDANAMDSLDRLYVETEKRIQDRRNRRVKFASP